MREQKIKLNSVATIFSRTLLTPYFSLFISSLPSPTYDCDRSAGLTAQLVEELNHRLVAHELVLLRSDRDGRSLRSGGAHLRRLHRRVAIE